MNTESNSILEYLSRIQATRGEKNLCVDSQNLCSGWECPVNVSGLYGRWVKIIMILHSTLNT
jgi:hypothetical protein